MSHSAADIASFALLPLSEIEHYLDSRLAVASGLLGLAVVEIVGSDEEQPVDRLSDHLEAEDYTARLDDKRYVIVRGPLVGPAEMEGLGLRIADSFPPPVPISDEDPIPRSPLHIGVVCGRGGDFGRTLLRHALIGMTDARSIGVPMVAVDDSGLGGLGGDVDVNRRRRDDAAHLGSQGWEQHDVADVGGAGEQHDDPVHPDAQTAGWW